ncbi:MAG: hypothetical protein J2P43_12730 [Candidatus Dormibacteraeota bacterium]|nr:hypothetical protein [Candidatus Dormibacteraeota bacterium]
MRWWKAAAAGVGLICLLYGTVAVFAALDRVSNSASDTLRPFVLTMTPVWLVALAGAWAWLRSPQPRQG